MMDGSLFHSWCVRLSQKSDTPVSTAYTALYPLHTLCIASRGKNASAVCNAIGEAVVDSAAGAKPADIRGRRRRIERVRERERT